MNRRQAISVVAIGAAALATGASVTDQQVTRAEHSHSLRAVWRWHEPSKEWIRCRMDTLKPGETCSVEEEPGSDRRYVGKVESHPRYVDGGVCEIMLSGDLITVPLG